MSEVIVTQHPHRPWCISVPILLGSTKYPSAYTTEWLSIKAANILQQYMQERRNDGRQYVSGRIRCSLAVDLKTSPGVITVEVYASTVSDEGLQFQKPFGLIQELVFLSQKLLQGLKEREAEVVAHGTVTVVTIPAMVEA